MKNVKNQLVMIAVAVLTLYATTSRADIIGGYVNTHQNEMLVAFDAVSAQKILIGASLDSIRLNEAADKKAGQLYIIYANGNFKVTAKSYRDKAGFTVSAPKGEFDKVIYLDRGMKIYAAIGLSNAEVAKFATLYKMDDAAKASELLKDERKIDLFEAVDLAAEGVQEAYDMDDDERADIFVSTVGFNGGLIAQEVITGIMDAALEDDEVPFAGISDILLGATEEVTTENLINGIQLVSTGDNGGQGGGGGGGKGVVNTGDNGGQGGGGGGGNGYEGAIVSGWADGAVSLDLPDAPFAANCDGTFVTLF